MLTSRHDSEQLSIFQAGNVVITIQERDGDCLKPLRQRIENSAGLVRTRKSDFLVYALIDSVLDHYFPVLEEFDNLLGEYDDELTLNGGTLPVQEIHQLRRQLVDVRKWLRPHREMIGQILRSETGFKPETLIFVKDCYDHVTQLAEGIEHCLETCSSLRDFHFNAVNNKTNEVMKTLTIISTIFIPLSFLAGVYGMNFSNMPGLQWRYGFAILTLGMLTIGGGMLAWFYRRGWFR
jgi:magnesium transporter